MSTNPPSTTGTGCKALGAYLVKHGISQEEFGKRLKNPVSQGLVWQWIEGRTKITLARAREIVAATGGEVTPHDCMPDDLPPGFEFPVQTEEQGAAAA